MFWRDKYYLGKSSARHFPDAWTYTIKLGLGLKGRPKFVASAFWDYKSLYGVHFFTTQVSSVHFLSLQKLVVCAFSLQRFPLFSGSLDSMIDIL